MIARIDDRAAEIERAAELAGRIDGAASRFDLLRADSIEPRAPEYLVRNYLERDSLGLVYSDPSVAKTFLALSWSCCIATGTDWYGHKVRTMPVVYVAGEGFNGLARRLRAWSIRHDVSLAGIPLFLSKRAASLTDIDELAAVRDAIRKTDTVPGLIVIDTLARNFGAGDENSTQDMTAFIAAADHLRDSFHSTVLIVHHTGHADKSRARGSMALKGALDAEYRLDKDEDGIIRLETTKMKDGSYPEPMAFRLRPVEIGIFDEDGAPVTSAVLDSTSYEPPPRKGKSGRGKWQTVAIEQLSNIEKRHRDNVVANGKDPATARVTVDDWRIECLSAGMPRQRWNEVRDSLVEQGAVRIVNGFAWSG